jgi:adenylosuccinate lyase
MSAALDAISPIDGRYYRHTSVLRGYFSEQALFKYRVLVEIEYFIVLSTVGIQQFPPLSQSQQKNLRAIYATFSSEDAEKIKEIEKRTNHDIKAVEYFIKDKISEIGLGQYKEWVHFGLTSQDINNTAIPLSIKDATLEVLLPELEKFTDSLYQLAIQWKNIPMLARTHGQAASPTGLGKEIFVFVERLRIQIAQLKKTVWAAKFGGATGNFNAHNVAFPQVEWKAFATHFVAELGLTRSETTTQIEHYDHLAGWCHQLIRIHTILVDFCRDVWTYISMDYFKQKVTAGEIGSSAMPHKVNPIDFENAEGNLGIANALLDYFALKLPISRLQRDLTDSTVLRNIGVPIAHSVIALSSLKKGIGKLVVNEKAIQVDLQKNAVVIAEAIQTVLRREAYPEPYEALKQLTRGKETIDLAAIQEFINSLDISTELKMELLAITPENYTGVTSF